MKIKAAKPPRNLFRRLENFQSIQYKVYEMSIHTVYSTIHVLRIEFHFNEKLQTDTQTHTQKEKHELCDACNAYAIYFVCCEH